MNILTPLDSYQVLSKEQLQNYNNAVVLRNKLVNLFKNNWNSENHFTVSIDRIFTNTGFSFLDPFQFKYINSLFRNNPEKISRLNILFEQSDLYNPENIFYRIIFTYYDNEFRRIFVNNGLISHYLQNMFCAERFNHVSKKINVINISGLNQHTDYNKFNILFSKYVRTEDNEGNPIATMIDTEKFFTELNTIDMVTLNDTIDRICNVIKQVTEFINDDVKFLNYFYNKLDSIKTISKVVETIEIVGGVETYIDAVDKKPEPKPLVLGISDMFNIKFNNSGQVIGFGVGSDSAAPLIQRDVYGFAVKSTDGVVDDDTIIFDSFEKRVHTKDVK